LIKDITLDGFIDILKEISELAYSDQKEIILKAPQNTSVGLIDDVKAARNPILSYRMFQQLDE
jgi:glycine dehydrogenase subunit 2